jgi:hypothetical protein
MHFAVKLCLKHGFWGIKNVSLVLVSIITRPGSEWDSCQLTRISTLVHYEQEKQSYTVETPETFGRGGCPAIDPGLMDGEFVAPICQDTPLSGHRGQHEPQRKSRTSEKRRMINRTRRSAYLSGRGDTQLNYISGCLWDR